MAFLGTQDLGTILGQKLFGSSLLVDSNRIPMTFTSTRRLKLLPSIVSQSFRRGMGENVSANEFISDMPVIEMIVNPNTISWEQPKRIVKRDFQEGSVYYHFTNSIYQDNDILTLNFSGNTGNIDQRADVGRSSGAFKKAMIWHNLWKLTREPVLILDDAVGLIKNEFLITYSSVAIPTDITLIGFFNNVLTWTDSADKPFTKDYSFSFIVEETIPDLDEIVSVLQTLTFDTSEVTTI